ADRSHTEDHSVVNQINGRNRVLVRLADIQDSRRRVVEDHTESRRDAAVVVVLIIPSAIEQGTHRTYGSEPVNGFGGVRLNDAAVCERDAKNRPPGAVRRPAQKRRADSATAERARKDLRWQTRREIAGEDASGLRVRSAGQWNPGRIENC